MPSSSLLRPERSLLHPAWIASLALLVANDHVFKGSGVLPGLITGKLSDLAGMLVAPALLATILCARTRRGVFAAHLAVALVFSLLEISPACARAAEQGMAAIGLSWRLWPDLTDLLALPVLFASWRILVPAMERPCVLRTRAVELARGALATAGLLSCIATSRGPEPVAPSQPMTVAQGVAASSLPSDLRGRWRSRTSIRVLAFESDRGYLATDPDGSETGRLELVSRSGREMRVRFTDRQVDGRSTPAFESSLVLSPNGHAFTLDGERYDRF